MGYYSEVSRDINKIPNAIQHFEDELAAARQEVKLKGNVERAAAELPGIVEQRFNQLQERMFPARFIFPLLVRARRLALISKGIPTSLQ